MCQQRGETRISAGPGEQPCRRCRRCQQSSWVVRESLSEATSDALLHLPPLLHPEQVGGGEVVAAAAAGEELAPALHAARPRPPCCRCRRGRSGRSCSRASQAAARPRHRPPQPREGLQLRRHLQLGAPISHGITALAHVPRPLAQCASTLSTLSSRRVQPNKIWAECRAQCWACNAAGQRSALQARGPWTQHGLGAAL